MSEIIVLFGVQGAGKSNAAESLRLNEGFRRVSLSDPLYEMVAVIMRQPVEEVRKLPKNIAMKELGGATLRLALQTLGTEWGRNTIHKRLWVELCLRRLDEFKHTGVSVAIDDCRFLNEYNALRGVGAKFVRIERANAPAQALHESEREWWNFTENTTIQNDAASAEEWLATASSRILLSLQSKV